VIHIRRRIANADFVDVSLADAMIEHGILESVGSGARRELAALRLQKWSVRTGRTRKKHRP
jgi:hypothetical protein